MPLSVTATICGGTVAVPSFSRGPPGVAAIPPPSTPTSWYGFWNGRFSLMFPTIATVGISTFISSYSASSQMYCTRACRAIFATAWCGTVAISDSPSSEYSAAFPAPTSRSRSCRAASGSVPPKYRTTTRSVCASARCRSINGTRPRSGATRNSGPHFIPDSTKSAPASRSTALPGTSTNSARSGIRPCTFTPSVASSASMSSSVRPCSADAAIWMALKPASSSPRRPRPSAFPGAAARAGTCARSPARSAGSTRPIGVSIVSPRFCAPTSHVGCNDPRGDSPAGRAVPGACMLCTRFAASNSASSMKALSDSTRCCPRPAQVE